MTDTVTLDPQALSELVPHRGCNLIPDEVIHSADGLRSEFTVQVGPGDERGRCVFGRQGPMGTCWQECVLPEILAIAGVSLLGERLKAAGQEGVYSAISRVQNFGFALMDQPLTGKTSIKRDRGNFVQYEGAIYQGGKEIIRGEFMSGAAALSEIADQAVVADSEQATEDLVADFSWKPAGMRFIDRVRTWDPSARRLEAAYHYPADHSLVPGHFPALPVMMGVTQWTAIMDAAWEARQRAGIDGPVEAEGTIVRADGSDVLDVRGLILDAEGDFPIMRATQRVAFRGPVQPGDGIRVAVTIHQVEQA